MEIIDAITGSFLLSVIAVPAALSLVVMLLNKHHTETSKLALQNSLATIGLTIVNVFALWALMPTVNRTANGLYSAVGIPSLPSSFWDSTPWWLITPIIFVVLDLCDYAIHRLMHRKWFWPTHAAHHSDTHVNAFTAYRVHFLELMLMSISYLVLATWLQLPGLLPVALLINRIWLGYVHMDLPWDHGRLRYIIASPVYHRWHHADTPAAHGKNLANKFPFIDLLFGTFYDAKVSDVTSVPMGATASNISDVNVFKLASYPAAQWLRLLRSQAQKLSGRTPPPPQQEAAPGLSSVLAGAPETLD